MTAGQDIDYEALAQDAMRGVVRTVLQRVGSSGLPGEHHFYIAFNTQAPGVFISKRLKERYAEEMTIVLQHRFWDLAVFDERFEVKLTFDGIPERLVVPFRAVKVFFDPSVPYGLQFEESELTTDSARRAGEDQNFVLRTDSRTPARSAPPERQDKRRDRTPRRTKPERANDAAPEAKSPAVPSAPRSNEAKPQRTASEGKTPDPAVKPAAGNANIVSLDQFRKK